jgi:tyrosyl-tRNA synthetase
MKLSDELKWRGFVNQTTYQDLSSLDNDKISFYFGVDPSADSMQIGNLAAAMMVRHFINAGHRAFLLVGGATGMIGDPDGKKDERNLKTLEEIAKNKAGIAAQYQTVFAGQDFEIVDNYEWFKDFGYLDFLREVGKYVPLSQMLDRSFVQNRLGQDGSGISYAEFSYALIQGYDFVHLNRSCGVTLQLCGADQWGNSVAGVDLLRRIDGTEAHVFSLPLIINKSTGQKFGKSENGAIWLDSLKTSVYRFYQFWLNVDDLGVSDYLKIYTLLPKQEIEEIIITHSKNPENRLAQKVLAKEVTDLVHGEERRKAVERVTNVLFGTEQISSLKSTDLDELALEIPVSSVGESVIDILTSTSTVRSRGDARRLLLAGSIVLNGTKISEDLTIKDVALIKKGKNSFILVR